MKKPQNKKFIVKKYVWATSALQAIKKEKKVPVDDVWVDENWLKEFGNKPPEVDLMGFKPAQTDVQ